MNVSYAARAAKHPSQMARRRQHSMALRLGLLLCAGQLVADNLCPPLLETQQTVAGAPAGYRIAEDAGGPHRLTYIEVFDGPVEEMASLVPQVQKVGESRWLFGAESAQRGIELACHYSRTRLMLVKRLPATTHSCVVKHRSNSVGQSDGSGMITSLQCR